MSREFVVRHRLRDQPVILDLMGMESYRAKEAMARHQPVATAAATRTTDGAS